jgi:hypothetical protein
MSFRRMLEIRETGEDPRTQLSNQRTPVESSQQVKRGRLHAQPPSLLSSLSKITESRAPERALVPRLNHLREAESLRHLMVHCSLRPHDDADVHDDEVRSTSSSTRSLPHDQLPPSRRWPPALRGSQPLAPALRPVTTSDSPPQREPLHHRRGSPR